jgi:hypothetical protein
MARAISSRLLGGSRRTRLNSFVQKPGHDCIMWALPGRMEKADHPLVPLQVMSGAAWRKLKEYR